MDALTAFLAAHGSGYSNGSGYVHGSGNGSGNGGGYGHGSGYGAGASDNSIREINGRYVHNIDGVDTIINHVHGNIAKGSILQADLTLTPCFVVKSGNTFAHGGTLLEATEALDKKLFEKMPVEKRVAAFVAAHDRNRVYQNAELSEWHYKLTGSCEIGREAFMRDHDIAPDGSMTIDAFLALTENAYKGEIIRQVKAEYEQLQQ